MDKIIKISKEAGFSILLLLIAIIMAIGLVKIKPLDQYQFWGIVITIVLIVCLAFFAYRKSGIQFSSSEWFDLIIEKLEDNDSAKIFLREFQHPDDFHEKHRNHLLKIMEIFKQKILNGSEIKIIAYHPTNNKNGFKWLEAELENNEIAKRHLNKMIKMIKTQAVGANSSSAYIFSDNSILYNQRINGKAQYHLKDLSNSILFHFASQGYTLIGENNE